ncbi:MAG: DUF4197 domain-containing protein [Nevskia sp.]|nr:DUF4197 domain-containing protein [Nevskia sp.]
MKIIRCTRLALAACLWAALPAALAGDPFGDLAKSMLPPAAGTALSDSDIGAGLKEALARGTRTAVNELGRSNGYWGNPRFRIPLPGAVSQAEGLLQQAGMGGQLEQLHLSFNRAAEQAVPVAADVFAQAVRQLSLNDVRGILNGPQDAATQYFKRTTSDTLAARFKPIVARVTAKVGLAQQYNAVMGSAGPMASMLGVDTDLDGYVTRKALDGLFLRVADEEKSIRTNPAARTTDLLKRVFGGHS